ncbi:hypothetical protein [Floridanema aerugineum]|uniref:Uncharacterized protein n=1 Tax=Floridaenema aerugineum BLCC-F46 TaxID=3153654 RepID=A0ABV4XCL0_9CYAN
MTGKIPIPQDKYFVGQASCLPTSIPQDKYFVGQASCLPTSIPQDKYFVGQASCLPTSPQKLAMNIFPVLPSYSYLEKGVI